MHADPFRELLEAAPDAILQVDREGRIVLLNAATEEMFGYNDGELVGQTIEILVPENFRALHERHRTHYQDSQVTRPLRSGLELRGRRKDGPTFPAEISLSPVKSSNGFRVTAIIRDITERKSAEEQLQDVQNKYMTM